MDYEIDIEEHDVLDNPFIRTVFPDISVIKKEITQYFDEPSIIKEPELVETLNDVQSKLNSKCHPTRVFHVSEKDKHAPPIQCNKIILGSKPNVLNEKKIGLKPDCDAQDDNGEHILNTHNALSKKLILGSKPTSDTQDNYEKKLILGSKPNKVLQSDIIKVSAKHKEKSKLKQMKVILQDIKSYLNQNGRYCKLCCRLFLSKHALDYHKKMDHHKKIFRNKNNKGTKNISETRYKCSICGSHFSKNCNLHRHYRNVHQKNIKFGKTNAKSRMANVKTNSYIKVNEIQTGNEKQKDCLKRKMHSNYTCIICSIQFASLKSLNRHLGTHSIENISKKDSSVKEEQFETAPVTKKQKINGNNNTSIALKTNPTQVVKIHDNKLKNRNETKIGKEKHTTEKTTKETSVEENCNSSYVTRARSSKSKESNLCLHCNKTFPDQKSLIEHMYEILEPKRISNETIRNATSDKTKTKEDKILFVCRQCSYYLPSFDAYYAHLIRNHKTVIFMDTKKEAYNPQCKYCSYRSSNITTHNRHIHSYHIDLMFMRIENEVEKEQSQINENFNDNAMNDFSSFALESVLFKCSKCSVCFLSSNIASNHKQHALMLGNWKCSICHHVLKERFKELHIKQHSFSQTMNVLNLNETTFSNVLYNCTKCAIHFNEKMYQEHYSNCGSDATDSFYCMVCDILVDEVEMIHHKSQHKHLKDISDFTIIDSNLIIDDSITNLKRTDTDMLSEMRFRKKLSEQHNCFTYCPTCKTFLNDLGPKNKSHIKGVCSHMYKYSCNECGLIFTSSTMQIHKERHDKDKKLRLRDFKFFDLQGNQIRPPIPEYPHCKICKIHFLRKNAISSHICDETDYLTCDICNIKLSEKTFKLHMSFHFYVIQKTSFANEKCSTPNQSSFSVAPNSTYRTPRVLDNETKSNIKSRSPFNSKIITEAETKSHQKPSTTVTTEPIEDLLIEMESLPKTTTNELVENNKIVVQESNHTDLVEEQTPNDDSLVVLYTCKTCGVSVESYDELIEHCQTHYSANQNENQIASMTKCKRCSLKFNSSSYLDHQQRIHSSVSKIHILKFDPSYFTSKNMIWVKHIFQNFPEEIVKKLLKNSIYQHEHRIRLECIQRGSSLLYVYKCDMCGNFIDPGSVYMHAENPCSKVRQYPCNHCGLPFISGFSRNCHENLHKQQRKGLTKKSFNIVLFNQIKDKPFNDRIFCTTNQYLFYQCRNCDRVVEKSLLTDHVCDRNSLVKCMTCGLLIGHEDFKAHVSMHTDLGNFYSENFKVILFGCKTNTNKVLKTLSPCFSGTVYDYTLYKCEICQMCIKNSYSAEKHTCIPNFELDRSMCSACDLYFPSGNLKYHTKQHRLDPDFSRENMNIIVINHDLVQIDAGDSNNDDRVMEKSISIENDDRPKDDHSKGKAKNSYIDGKKQNADGFENKEKSDDDDKDKRVDCISVVTDGKDETVYDAANDDKLETLYKCNCGLHFLNKLKVTEHLEECPPSGKQCKQTCSKCHLLFKTSELFAHLVVHHKNKSKVQRFRVIEIASNELGSDSVQ